MEDEWRSKLFRLADLLGDASENFYAEEIRKAAESSDETMLAFLVSNDLWGGSGSVADSAFTFNPGNDIDQFERRQNRNVFEKLMIDLGRSQIAAHHVNVRTLMWVEAFEMCQRERNHG